MVASTSAPAALGPEPVSLAPWAQAALVQPGRVTRGEELQGCRTSRYRMSSKAVGCGVARVWRAGRVGEWGRAEHTWPVGKNDPELSSGSSEMTLCLFLNTAYVRS